MLTCAGVFMCEGYVYPLVVVLFITFMTVSYTHLDVYKRQINSYLFYNDYADDEHIYSNNNVILYIHLLIKK